LSSAIRLFVLEHYRGQTDRDADAGSGGDPQQPPSDMLMIPPRVAPVLRAD
jgi:hypothetical protein